MHVLVVEMGTCSLYETWSSKYVGPGWSCGSGAEFKLSSNALRPDGWTSADAAGLPILPGLVKVSEVMAGAVNHAVRFTMNSTQQAYIHPAVHAAGKSDTSLPPMGLRLRLKASFDTTAFSGATKVVLVALQQYGIILADNGSDWYISGDSDDAWTPLMDSLVSDLAKVHGSDFEAVDTGPISTAGLQRRRSRPRLGPSRRHDVTTEASRPCPRAARALRSRGAQTLACRRRGGGHPRLLAIVPG